MSHAAPSASPTVSVIMAAYNGAPFIAETLDSLSAQTFGDFEVVIVDDRSRDDTAALVRAYGDPRIRLIAAEANRGPVHARNRAFAEARGRYIAGLDQDDCCHPDRFARQVAFLDANPDIVLAGTGAMLIEQGRLRPSGRIAGLTPTLIDWVMLTRNPLVWSSVMFRADAARALTPFERPERLCVEDFDLYHRLRRFGRLAEIDAPLACYRIHSGGMSARFTARMLENADAVLGDAHVALLGEPNPEALARIVRHVMAREPVPNVAVLRALFDDIARLQAAFVRHYALDSETRTAIADEVSALWWRTSRAAIRSGAMPLTEATAARPGKVIRDSGRQGDLLVSEMIGRMRALRHARGAV